MPILVINDSPIKQFAENEHAVGQSVLEAYMRITNRITNGQRVTVFGYGACGRGVAANFRAGLGVTLLLVWTSRRYVGALGRSPFVRRLLDDIAGQVGFPSRP